MSNDAEHEALLEARDFIQNEADQRRSGCLDADPYVEDALRVLAIIDAALTDDDHA